MKQHLLVPAAHSDMARVAIYLFLSGLTGFFELGVVIGAIRTAMPPATVLGLALAYQVGALLKNPVALTARHYRLILIGAVVAAIYQFKLPWLLAPAVLFTSIGLQAIREEALQGQSVSTTTKRISRIAGFVGAGLFDPRAVVIVPLAVVIVTVILDLTTARYAGSVRLISRRGLGANGLAMVVHQAHYFTYVYAVPWLFLRMHGLSGVCAGVAFALGWISYTVAPRLLGRLAPLPVVIIGHIAVAMVLLSITVEANSLAILLIAWFISGFGGGTVYCIRRLAELWTAVDRTGDLDMWENVGHVLGVSCAIVVVSVTGQIILLFTTASALAFITVLIIALTAWRRRHFNTDHVLAASGIATGR